MRQKLNCSATTTHDTLGGEKWESEKNILSIVEPGGCSTILWSCMAASCTGNIVWVEGSRDATKYQWALEVSQSGRNGSWEEVGYFSKPTHLKPRSNKKCRNVKELNVFKIQMGDFKCAASENIYESRKHTRKKNTKIIEDLSCFQGTQWNFLFS